MTFKEELDKLLKKHKYALLSYIKLGNLDEYQSQTLKQTDIIDYGYAKERGVFIEASLKEKPKKQEDITPYKKAFSGFTFKEFVSPIDGTRIASTAALRDHERKHGVKQVGNDFNNITKEKYGHSEQ